MTVAIPGQTPAILGFAIPAGLALALSAMLLSYPPRVDVPADGAETEQSEATTHLYIAVEEPIFVALGEGPRMRMDLAVSVEGTSEQLLDLNEAVGTAMPRVTAAIVQEAQALVADGADSLRVHAELPAQAKRTINAMLGTDEFPAPVTEVLIVGLAVQS